MISISIYRYNPEADDKPYRQVYRVDPQQIRGIMLLDALIWIQEHLDPTLTFRRSCGQGVCGSDGMNINGKNNLACTTLLNSLGKKITLNPLPSLPVIRDLVVDQQLFFDKLKQVKAYLINDEPADRERLQMPEQLEEFRSLTECILCACCTTSCPSFWWNGDKFAGPAALLWACRFIMDNRDNETQKRLTSLQDFYTLFRCRSIGMCQQVCPKGLNPTQAIATIRQKMLKESV